MRFATSDPGARPRGRPLSLRDQPRLSPADAALLELEARRSLPLHGGIVLVFDGAAPGLGELTEHVRSRLAALPRYRARAAGVPLRQGRPVWVAQEPLALERHVSALALPGPGGRAELAALAGELLARPLERRAPLWRLWLVERVGERRFALIAAGHPALVSGASGELVSALLDGGGEPAQAPPHDPAGAGALELLLGALLERASSPRALLEPLRDLERRAREELAWRGLDPLARLSAPPRSALNAHPGPHRALALATVGLRGVRRARDRLGGTVTDAVLTALAGALGEHLRARGEDTDGLVLRALLPIADARGRLLAAYAPLPVGIGDPRARHAEISRALDGLRASGRARAAARLVDAPGYAPARAIMRAARLQALHPSFNVALANVPGPRTARALLGRELRRAHPVLPLGTRQTLSIALTSQRGRLCFGILADPDAGVDPAAFAALLAEALRELPRARR